MNIVHLVLGKANPERMNGVNKVVDSLAKEQGKLGHHVSVWGITPTTDDETSQRAYELRLFPALKHKFFLSEKLTQAIKTTPEQTIFHIHGGFIPEFYHIVRQLNAQKIRFVFTPHGNYAANALRKNRVIKKLYFNLLEKEILKSSKAVQCISKGEWEELDQLIKLPNKVLVPNGQNIKQIGAKQGENMQNSPIFGYCGRVTREQKGLDLLQEGFRKYVRELKGQGNLWIIGEGEYLEDMKQFAQKHELTERFVFWGAQFGDRKNELLSQMDAFYHTSRNEGLPMALLEAASMGIPMVVSTFTNLGEAIQKYDAGLVLEQNDPEQIALSMKEMAELHDDGSIIKKGTNALKMVEEDFNWNKIAKDLIEVYEC